MTETREPNPLFAERELHSKGRLNQLQARIAKLTSADELPNLAIFCAGSYARHEASEHSDIDLFFIYDGTPSEAVADPRTKELRLFGALIEAADEMGFPAFSNDSEYLKTLSSKDLLDELGSPEDDAKNHFTLRMLMMLESKPLYGHGTYEKILRDILGSYYRDYPDHQASFEPWFLLNDIGRFWKTLLLNYEHKRNQGVDRGLDIDIAENIKAKQKVKNFKLKFSRMTTCFATVAALGSVPKPVEVDDLMTLIGATPRERLHRVSEWRPDTEDIVQELFEDYAWFLQYTGLPEPELRSLFKNDKTRRRELFDRANDYGTKMYRLIATIDNDMGGPQSSFIRYLVV